MPAKGQLESIAERLERNSMPEPNSGCQLWLGTVGKNGGHGRMKVAGKWESPHRVAYIAKRGPIPDGLDLLHKCDVPICINDAHLFPGTHQDNMKDMWAKGRGRGKRRATGENRRVLGRYRPVPKTTLQITCARCGSNFVSCSKAKIYCSNKCRWKVSRTDERRDRYNVARNIKRHARRASASA